MTDDIPDHLDTRGRLDGLPDEARCGLCSDLIVASRSVNGRVTWCHAEVPTVGHEALYAPGDAR